VAAIILAFRSYNPATASIVITNRPMPLTTGSRLGSYEILSLLGVGGMGEV